MWCLTSKSPHVFKHSAAILYTIGSNVLQCPGALSLWNYSLIGNIGSLTALAPRYSHIPNERGRLTAGVGAIHPMTPRFCNQPTYIPVSTWWKDPVIVGARWRHLPVSCVHSVHTSSWMLLIYVSAGVSDFPPRGLHSGNLFDIQQQRSVWPIELQTEIHTKVRNHGRKQLLLFSHLGH